MFHKKHFNQVICDPLILLVIRALMLMLGCLDALWQSILQFARQAGFRGNLVLTTRLLGLSNADKLATLELVRATPLVYHLFGSSARCVDAFYILV